MCPILIAPVINNLHLPLIWSWSVSFPSICSTAFMTSPVRLHLNITVTADISKWGYASVSALTSRLKYTDSFISGIVSSWVQSSLSHFSTGAERRCSIFCLWYKDHIMCSHFRGKNLHWSAGKSAGVFNAVMDRGLAWALRPLCAHTYTQKAVMHAVLLQLSIIAHITIFFMLNSTSTLNPPGAFNINLFGETHLIIKENVKGKNDCYAKCFQAVKTSFIKDATRKKVLSPLLTNLSPVCEWTVCRQRGVMCLIWAKYLGEQDKIKQDGFIWFLAK